MDNGILKMLRYPSINENGRSMYHIEETSTDMTKCADLNLYGPIIDFLKNFTPNVGCDYYLDNALSAGDFYGPNLNGDWFGEEMLKKRHPTFVSNSKFYKFHINKDPKISYGRPIFSHYDEDMHRVLLVLEIHGDKIPEIRKRYDAGDPVFTSMGCAVPYDVCSICGNKAKNRTEYCKHVTRELHKIYHELGGKRSYMINQDGTFFDNSYVIIPADQTAFFLKKLNLNDKSSFDLADELGAGISPREDNSENELVLTEKVASIAQDPENLKMPKMPKLPKPPKVNTPTLSKKDPSFKPPPPPKPPKEVKSIKPTDIKKISESIRNGKLSAILKEISGSAIPIDMEKLENDSDFAPVMSQARKVLKTKKCLSKESLMKISRANPEDVIPTLCSAGIIMGSNEFDDFVKMSVYYGRSESDFFENGDPLMFKASGVIDLGLLDSIKDDVPSCSLLPEFSGPRIKLAEIGPSSYYYDPDNNEYLPMNFFETLEADKGLGVSPKEKIIAGAGAAYLGYLLNNAKVMGALMGNPAGMPNVGGALKAIGALAAMAGMGDYIFGAPASPDEVMSASMAEPIPAHLFDPINMMPKTSSLGTLAKSLGTGWVMHSALSQDTLRRQADDRRLYGRGTQGLRGKARDAGDTAITRHGILGSLYGPVAISAIPALARYSKRHPILGTALPYAIPYLAYRSIFS